MLSLYFFIAKDTSNARSLLQRHRENVWLPHSDSNSAATKHYKMPRGMHASFFKSGDNRLRCDSTGRGLIWDDGKKLPVTSQHNFELFFSIQMIRQYVQSNEMQKLKQKRRNMHAACQLLVTSAKDDEDTFLDLEIAGDTSLSTILKTTTKQPEMKQD